MKSASTVLLALILLIQTFLPVSENHEIAKFQGLFNHFKEHKVKDQIISFGEFLVLHYFDDYHRNEDQENHSKIPFGTNHHHCTSFFSFLLFTNPRINLPIPSAKVYKPGSFYLVGVTLSRKSDIWQPPKIG